MVFSQTSLNTQSILKLVELDRIKAEKNQQVNGTTGVVIGGNLNTTLPSPMATNSYTEVFLKSEPLPESTMYSDYEFFQDLQWSFAPAKGEQVQTIDLPKKTEERALQIDTLHTPFSPQGWEPIDANSSFNTAGFYNTTPIEPLSPNIENFGQTDGQLLNLPEMEKDSNTQFQEKIVDLSSLPVVIGDLASETVAGSVPWLDPEQLEWTNAHDIAYNQPYINTHNIHQPFIDAEEDSLDLKLSFIPREVESNNVVITEYIINDDPSDGDVLMNNAMPKRGEGLSVDVSARAPQWPDISTPEVLSYVEQLEKEKCPPYSKLQQQPPTPVSPPVPQETFTTTSTPPVDYEPIAPKSEFHAESDDDVKIILHKRKRRHDSEDSDKSYTPQSETTPKRLGKKKKPSVPIKDMILALEGSQTQSPVRRGRPPKRRESTVSSACSVDENSSSTSTQETKYRELRDKNNEASKRSRMNRKLKELQMEQLADELEEKNKNLRIRADILENMTKRLKSELMTAILNK